MTAPGTFRLAVVRGGQAEWAAAEVVISDPEGVTATLPTPARLIAVLLSATGAPDPETVHRIEMDCNELDLGLTVHDRAAFLAWSRYLGLTPNVSTLDPAHLTVIRAGHVVVAGVRLQIGVRLLLPVTGVAR